jgi:hypothetical protein
MPLQEYAIIYNTTARDPTTKGEYGPRSEKGQLHF